MGRVTRYTEREADGDLSYDRETTYNARSQVLAEITMQKNGADRFDTTATYAYHDDGGAYLGGSVARVNTHELKNDNTQQTTVTKTSYAFTDVALQKQINYDAVVAGADDVENESVYYYDANGHLNSVGIEEGVRSRNLSYVTDAAGQVVSRTELQRDYTGPAVKQLYFYFDGLRVGEIGNNGPVETDYAEALADRNKAAQTGPWRYGIPKNYANFDQNYDPITPTSQSGTSSKYVVRAGDTLQSVAAAVWGDGAMWYLIAEANGLTASSELQVGVTLSIPAKVANVHNNVDTFRPYDPNQAIGDTNPSEPKPPTQKEAKCGIVGQILLVAIAVAVTVVTSGAAAAALGGVSGGVLGGLSAMTAGTIGLGATVAAGAIGAAVGSVVSQGVGVMTGIQDKFSWKGVAMSALSGGVSAGVGASTAGLLKGMDSFVGGAIRGTASNMITQGIGVATGLQDRFDWVGVAAAGIVSGVSAKAGELMPGGAIFENNVMTKAPSLAHLAVTGAAGAMAGAATRSVITGTNFGDNLMRVLPDAIGSTIGNLVANGVAARSEARHVRNLVNKAGLGANDGDNQTSMEFAQRLRGQNLSDKAILDILSTPGINTGLRDFDAARAGGISAELAEGRLTDFVSAELERLRLGDAARLEAERLNSFDANLGVSSSSPLEVTVTDYGVLGEGLDGGTITQKVISGGISLVDGLLEYQERHPLLAEIVFETAKPLLSGGPVKALVTTVAKGSFGAGVDRAQAFAAEYANEQVSTFVSRLADEWGWNMDVSIAGANVNIGGSTIGGASGEMSAAAVEAALGGSLSAVSHRGRNVRSVVSGGAYRDVKGIPGNEAHHMPANSVSPFSKRSGPAISMDAQDHKDTASWGSSREAKAYRNHQRELMEQGRFREAQQLDIEDVRARYGDKYDDAIDKMQKYTDELLGPGR